MSTPCFTLKWTSLDRAKGHIYAHLQSFLQGEKSLCPKCLRDLKLARMKSYKRQYLGDKNIQLFYTCLEHYDDVIMGAMASQITSLTIVY